MLHTFQTVHFIGIGGYGMSALAYILLRTGYVVQGSDIKMSTLVESLENSGAKIFRGHSPAHIDGADLVVYSTAIPADNSELAAARGKSLTVWHRSELLAALLNTGCGIAVAGAHGKTTTSAMLSLILEKGGLDPTALVGGEVPSFNGNARLGSSNIIVAEACESDHSFLRYKPYLALITNIEADHLEHYEGNFQYLLEGYRQFINNVKREGTLIYCGDDPFLMEMQALLPPNSLSYGLSQSVDFRGELLELQEMGSRFAVSCKGEHKGNLVLNIPGSHNVLNALGAAAAALVLGVDFKAVQEALYSFTGARRRFEKIGEENDILVIDDYAHHSTEVRVTLEAARRSGRRVICVFQPHRYTRTSFLWNEFVEAFNDADILMLSEIYGAGEEPLEGVNSGELGLQISERTQKNVYVAKTGEELLQRLIKVAVKGDIVLTMGAGDIWQVGRNYYQYLLRNSSIHAMEDQG